MKNRPSRTISPGKIWGRTAPRCLRASVSNGCLLKAHRAPPFEGDLAVQDPRPHQLTKKRSHWKSPLPDRYYHPFGFSLRFMFVALHGQRSDSGWEVRVKGSQIETAFSTTANDTIPVSVPNLWMPSEKQYQVPTVIEFAVTEITDAGATLTILTKGWIDSRGREPN